MNFNFLRIPVRVQPMFWVLLLFFTGLSQGIQVENIILGLIFFVSLLVHEYGHALTALYFGANPGIVLDGFGGQTQYNAFRITAKQQFIITLNGPLLESVLIVVPYALLNLGVFASSPMITYTLYMLMRVNILWCLFNLVPVAPLDGGYLLRYLLGKKWGEKGEKASKWIGLAIAALCAPYLFYSGYFFGASLLALFGLCHWQELRKDLRIFSKSSHFRCHMKALEAMREDKLQNAKGLLKRLLKTQSVGMRHSAIESLAKIYIKEKKEEKAYALLLQADPEFLKEGKCLLCRLAYERGSYALVAKYSQEIYAIEPSYEIAVLNAKAFANLGEEEMSQGWFATAAQFETLLV